MFYIALLEPEIAPNVGNIARTCLALGAELHLIRPLGFRINDDALKRSGMDYWDEVPKTLHSSYTDFREAFASQFEAKRVFSLSTKGTARHSDAKFEREDVLLFGPESRGLPLSIRDTTQVLRIPMRPEARSLNLAVSVGITAYEAWRQLGFA